MNRIEEIAKAYAMGRAYAQGVKMSRRHELMARGKVLKN